MKGHLLKNIRCFFIITLGVFFSCVKDKPAYLEDSGAIFSTSYHIKYKYTRSLKGEIEKKLQEFDDSLNPFKSTSIISKVNNNEEVELDSLFINVFNRSEEVAKASDGLFDITISPLINAWGFGFKNMENVDDVIVDSLLQFVGYGKVKIKENRVVKADNRITLNMSAIAKGYSSDIIASLLESYGINDYMIEIGGEIRVKGLNAKGKCWQIAVNEPPKINGGQHATRILQLCNKSIATSGSYFKYYIKDGKRYAHTIDPRTGRPAENNILSATVIADDCMTADAYATVFMLADTLEARKIAQEQGLAYMLILGKEDNGCQIIQSDNFKNFILEK